jgi:thiamine-monophosphate kinase
MNRLTENDLVRRIGSAASSLSDDNAAVRLGIGDDAALFCPRRGYETILTCDWFLEGTHFLRDKHPADSIGWKCLARAVSDIAAMGGQPRGFLLSLAIPESHTGPWLDEFLRGLRRAARKFGCPLAGGDTTRRSDILINVTVLGEVRSGRASLRSGARPGDMIYVSGHLGEADLGLQRLGKGRTRNNDPVLRKHLYPEPRIALGRWLAENRIATAMMDLSDGISADLPRLCAASRVGARLNGSRIPTVPLRRQSGLSPSAALDLALHGGDDYELLFTVRPDKARRVPRRFQRIALTAIGEITHEQQRIWVGGEGQEQNLSPGGWDPFRRSKS